MFNVMLYVDFMLHEALTHTQRQYDTMRGGWNDMLERLAAARAAAETEREKQASNARALKIVQEEFALYKELNEEKIEQLEATCEVCGHTLHCGHSLTCSPESVGQCFGRNCSPTLSLLLTGGCFGFRPSPVDC